MATAIQRILMQGLPTLTGSALPPEVIAAAASGAICGAVKQ